MLTQNILSTPFDASNTFANATPACRSARSKILRITEKSSTIKAEIPVSPSHQLYRPAKKNLKSLFTATQ